MFLEDISGGRQVIRSAALCFTDAGQKLAESIPGLKVYRYGRDFSDSRYQVEKLFSGQHSVSAVVFFSSVGIAVRLVAPYAADKMTDPAVIVVNDTAQFVIPILSGHMGRANDLAWKLAELLEAQPVITTASDHRDGIEPPDLWALREGYTLLNKGDVKKVTAAIVAGGKPERVLSGNTLVWKVGDNPSVAVSHQKEVTASMTPQKYVVGLGCRREVDPEDMRRFVDSQFAQIGIDRKDVFKICSIDRKAEETALLDLAQDMNRPFVVFSAEHLNRIKGVFSSSEFVSSVAGTNNVCERSALAGCAPWGGKLIIRKIADHGMTIAIAERILSSEAEKNK